MRIFAGVKRQWGNRKTSIFRDFGRYVFGVLGNEANILYSIIKSSVAFPLTPKYMTLNDQA